jgi:hypothetical protein
LEHTTVAVRIILEWIFNEQEVRFGTEFKNSVKGPIVTLMHMIMNLPGPQKAGNVLSS